MKNKILIITICILIISCIYLSYCMGRTQGRFQTQIKYVNIICDNPIYPYGCKIEPNATHCIDFECKGLGSLGNVAICLKMDDTISNYSTFKKKGFLTTIGLMFGCKASLHEIGINKYNGNENWLYNKI